MLSRADEDEGFFEVDEEPSGIAQAFVVLLTGALLVATFVAVCLLIFVLGQYGR